MSDMPALYTATGLNIGDDCQMHAHTVDDLIEVELSAPQGDVHMTLTRRAAEEPVRRPTRAAPRVTTQQEGNPRVSDKDCLCGGSGTIYDWNSDGDACPECTGGSTRIPTED